MRFAFRCKNFPVFVEAPTLEEAVSDLLDRGLYDADVAVDLDACTVAWALDEELVGTRMYPVQSYTAWPMHESGHNWYVWTRVTGHEAPDFSALTGDQRELKYHRSADLTWETEREPSWYPFVKT